MRTSTNNNSTRGGHKNENARRGGKGGGDPNGCWDFTILYSESEKEYLVVLRSQTANLGNRINRRMSTGIFFFNVLLLKIIKISKLEQTS
jgi:hypothetical protein